MTHDSTYFYPCINPVVGCTHLGNVHAPTCVVCGCPDHIPWEPPALLPDTTQDERDRGAVVLPRLPQGRPAIEPEETGSYAPL
mgnify:CR=1 FL=1